jgi:hypothetical protein
VAAGLFSAVFLRFGTLEPEMAAENEAGDKKQNEYSLNLPRKVSGADLMISNRRLSIR